MNKLKAAALAAFNHSKTLEKVFVSSDAIAFILETDARQYAKTQKLEDTTITPFTRNEAMDQPTFEDETTLIPKIKGAKTNTEVYELVCGWTDTRAEVIAVAKERLNEIAAFNSGNGAGSMPGII